MNLFKRFTFISENVGAVSTFVFFDAKTEPNVTALSSKEAEIYSKFISHKRQHEFIAGRIACKKALFKLISKKEDCKTNCSEKFPSISVLNTKTGAPCIENSDLFVSVSHSHGVAIASVSEHAVGVDIEQINPKRISALKKMSIEIEPKFQDVTSLTALWTLKESLGKALQTGIVEDFRHYDTKNFRSENGLYCCDFKNFPSFSGIAIAGGKYAVALVCPKKQY